MLVTNDEELATKARSFSSLGYKLDPKSPRIDPSILKSPDYERHHTYPAWNYRMNDVTAQKGLWAFDEKGIPFIGADGAFLNFDCGLDALKHTRKDAASLYAEEIKDCEWIAPQFVPDGWTCDYWAFAFAVAEKSLWHPLVDAMVRHGAEMPFGAWKLTYQEPAFRHLAPDGTCPVAENLQPRILQCQTNDLASAERNATALRKAIAEIGGSQ
jgi:perosamine synthetase